MNHSKWYIVGIFAGVIFGVVMFLIYLVRTRRRFGKCEFDERQELARGKAFKYGFFTSLIYFGLLSLGGIMAAGDWMRSPLWVYVGVCLTVGVFAGNAIWNDAYFSMNETPKFYIYLFIALAALNLFGGIRGIVHGGSKAGDLLLGENSLNLCLGVTLFCLLVVLGVKWLWDKKTGEED